MTTNLPAIIDPLTPPDCDLRAYEFMPLSVLRLRDSVILSEISGDGFRTAVLLWCASWHQVPAASLPDDDRLLARLGGFGLMINAWRAIREEALYGFVKASDGRLYHPVIAEKALESWAKRSAFVARSKAANDAKYGKKKARKPKPGKASSYKDVKILPKDSEGKGSEGNGSEDKEERSDDLSLVDEVIDVDPIADGFALFWATYPKRTEKPRAAKAFREAVRKLKDGSLASRIKFLIDHAQRFADHFGDETHFAVPPTTWLKDQRWHDELIPRKPRSGVNGSGASFAPDSRQSRTDSSQRGAALALEFRRRVEGGGGHDGG